MSRWQGDWGDYVPVAERRHRAARAMATYRRAGQGAAPVTISGRAIASTFWGRAWCDNIESYRDFESRLPRGRSYLRNGSVLDLRIAPGRVDAVVCGSELYDVAITVVETPSARWRSLCADCAGGIDSIVELLQGRLSQAVMERLCRQQGGLFPRPSEIRFSCTCPDHADMCKHVAAVLYGVGARLDQQPELLFRLRKVDETDLVAQVGAGLNLVTRAPASCLALPTDDLAALFGLDLAIDETRPAPRRGPADAVGTGQRRATGPKPAKAPAAVAKPRSAVGPIAPDAKKAAAVRSAVRHTSKASRKAEGPSKAEPNGTKSKGRPELTAPGQKQREAVVARGVATGKSDESAARKRTGSKANASGNKQKPVRWW